jgi:hypothetical protein
MRAHLDVMGDVHDHLLVAVLERGVAGGEGRGLERADHAGGEDDVGHREHAEAGDGPAEVPEGFWRRVGLVKERRGVSGDCQGPLG